MRIRYTYTTAVLLFTLVSSPAVAQERNRPPLSAPGTVTLTLSEYDRLVDRASRPDPRPAPPPANAVLSRAQYHARVDGTIVRGTLKVDGEVFRKGPVKIPLLDGVALFEGKADGRPLPLIRDNGGNATVISGPATFSAVLDWGVALEASPGHASFTLPAVQAGSVTATVDLPGDPVDVRVDFGVITRRQSASGRTLLQLTSRSGQRAQVLWAVRESGPQVQPADARMLADVKSLWRIGEADVQLIALVDITMIRGTARTFSLQLPAGFEVSSVNGGSLEASESKGGTLILTVRDTQERRHQFLVSAERGHEAGPFKLEAPLVSLPGAQRETGEVAIEAAGTVEVNADGDPALRRMDVREVHASLRQLAREPLLAAFRYQRRPGETRSLALDVKRFPDAPVIAAVADRAVATTLVTTEGRMLTEVALWVRNQAQPFVEVTLPSGATMLSVEVEGESARPVQGTDGLRVPLLRPGFRPAGAYRVSFVYLNAGRPFEKRGDTRMALAAIDLPISVLEWELFVPDRYSVKSVGGNVIPSKFLADTLRPGEAYGATAETVTVSGEAPVLDTKSSERSSTFRAKDERAPNAAVASPAPAQEQQASQNVLNLQRRVAGVLPVRIDVPRTGSSHRFTRPLVLGDETEVSLKYKRK